MGFYILVNPKFFRCYSNTATTVFDNKGRVSFRGGYCRASKPLNSRDSIDRSDGAHTGARVQYVAKAWLIA